MSRILKTASFVAALANASVMAACFGRSDSSEPAPVVTAAATPAPERYIYVAASGLSTSTGCYGGGVSTTGASAPNVVSRFRLENGAFDKVVCDWSPYSGDNPVSIDNDYADSGKLMVLVENATSGRRIDLCDIASGAITTYLSSAGFGGVLRKLRTLPKGDVYVSDSTSIERFDPNKNRVTGAGAYPNNAFIQSPPGNCATATTNISAFFVTPSLGRVLFAHAAATPNNHIGYIESDGYRGNATDCLPTAKIAAPSTTAMATHFLLHSSGKMLVAYGSTTAASNFVYAYDFDETNGGAPLTGATSAYFNTSVLNGPSSMVEDTQTGAVYVANALSTLNTIEKFAFSSSSKTLTRATTSPFIASQLMTRCMADMLIHE
jgi:hypothetical protein